MVTKFESLHYTGRDGEKPFSKSAYRLAAQDKTPSKPIVSIVSKEQPKMANTPLAPVTVVDFTKPTRIYGQLDSEEKGKQIDIKTKAPKIPEYMSESELRALRARKITKLSEEIHLLRLQKKAGLINKEEFLAKREPLLKRVKELTLEQMANNP